MEHNIPAANWLIKAVTDGDGIAADHGYQAMLERFVRQHSWYVDMVVRSKLIAIYGQEPEDGLKKQHGRYVEHRPTDVQDWFDAILWNGFELIRWRGPRFDAAAGTMVMDYVR